MKYLMLYETDPASLPKAATHVAAHRARLDEFHARGLLLMAGPLVDPTDQALGVFVSREAADEFIAGDPFVQNGVVTKWTVREWNEVLT